MGLYVCLRGDDDDDDDIDEDHGDDQWAITSVATHISRGHSLIHISQEMNRFKEGLDKGCRKHHSQLSSAGGTLSISVLSVL